ncbi:hypothetical protein AAFF_G00279280 [Aldrovandia affinis]|uniref:Uncharacterized protein n=1 Tax=Aldrovandia affinis TaxID=143900 RepID=A0AAD7WT37_9TELE|nr:hypothetical protein AAFF_G00279280 [Aldrovandia affinis]
MRSLRAREIRVTETIPCLHEGCVTHGWSSASQVIRPACTRAMTASYPQSPSPQKVGHTPQTREQGQEASVAWHPAEAMLRPSRQGFTSPLRS